MSHRKKTQNKNIVRNNVKNSVGSSGDTNKSTIAFITVIILIIISAVAFLINYENTAGDRAVAKLIGNRQKVNILIKTDRGEMIAELRPDLMPVTVKNFVKLVHKKFYNGLTFHRVEDWVIQGGDPNGDGTGGPGWTVKLETNDQLKNVKYCIAMARGKEPNTAGSQFYILKKDMPSLNGNYAVFGNIIKGQDVIDKISAGDKILSMELTD